MVYPFGFHIDDKINCTKDRNKLMLSKNLNSRKKNQKEIVEVIKGLKLQKQLRSILNNWTFPE